MKRITQADHDALKMLAFIALLVLLFILGISFTINSFVDLVALPETECEEYVGPAYVYDGGECYRLLDDDTLERVDVAQEKKIGEAQKRMMTK